MSMSEWQPTSHSINGVITEGMHMILMEAASCLEYQHAASQILSEAADNPNYQLIQESALDAVKQMTIKFLGRCEQVSRAVVARLKEFGLKLSGKTEEYVRAVQPRIEAAKRHAGWESLHADIYPWNPMFLESGIGNGIRKLHMSWNTQVVASETLESILREVKSHKDSIDEFLSDRVDQIEYAISSVDETAIEACAQAFGLSANDVDELMAAITIKAHGDAREPGYTFGRDIDKIMATLINSSKLVDNVRQTYESHAKELHEFASTVKGELDEAESLMANGEISGTDAISNAIRLSQQYTVKMTEYYESLMGKANSLNISLIQQMCADYMRCVNMFVAYRGAQRTPDQN